MSVPAHSEKPVRPTPGEIERFLAAYHGEPVTDLEPLRGGYWSSAYAYRVSDRPLVLRLASEREGFEIDRAAFRWRAPDLPVPEVLDVGEAFGAAFAISVRHFGRFLEDAHPGEAEALGSALMRTLAALRAVPAEPDAPAEWFSAGSGADSTWARWLLDALLDDPRRTVHGWRAVLAAQPEIDSLFETACRRVRELVESCPERRDLVHGDLLHQNVLVSDTADQITAVFSWKCSARGDFLYDVAWCSFWEPWHPGIQAIDVWGRTLGCETLRGDALRDAALRHLCYELQIGATHLGWNAFTGDQASLDAVARRTQDVLDRGL